MVDPASRVRVVAEAGFEARASGLAERLGLPRSGPTAFELIVDAEGLGLRPAEAGARVRPVRARLDAARPGGEEVVRAVRGRRPLHEVGLVVDATAGLGVDASALARAGLRVAMIEREPVIHALLEDGLARLRTHAEGSRWADRLTLLSGDAEALLAAMVPPPDVVYLDPMYPAGRGGAKRRPMAWIREMLGEDAASAEDERRLLDAARRAAVRRVVLKRPAKAPPSSPDVSGSLGGRTTRFDLYAPREVGGGG